MAWNEPPNGDDNKENDPWGNRNRNKNDGPPELDEIFNQLNGQIKKIFGGGNGKNNKNDAGGFGAIVAILLIGVIGWLGFQSIYTVDEQERAVVLRLGKLYAVQQQGLQFKIPFIDDVSIVNITKLDDVRIKEQMLTQDENIVDITLRVQYRRQDAAAYSLNVLNPEKSLQAASESALRHVVGSMRMDTVITDGRSALAIEVKQRIQKHMDDYETGIFISTVNLEDAAPPAQVQASYDDVVKAREDEVRVQDEARFYLNSIVPKAEAQANRLIQEAEAYKAEVLARAEGETVRFESLLSEYQKAPEVTRQRLYLDTVSKVMSNNQKVMVDVEGGNNMMYLPLDRLGKQGLGSAELEQVTNQVVSEIIKIQGAR